ncbi:MAG: hypothetical protein AB7I98_04975 [Verrucomicrobiales bacterium]|nr:hypothetical protein [Verrucomicrobiae bacterium]MCP5552560.1 hypothetical protein [Akkermansiaceae bacterium]
MRPRLTRLVICTTGSLLTAALAAWILEIEEFFHSLVVMGVLLGARAPVHKNTFACKNIDKC